MKQRMYNTFLRIFKNKYLTGVITDIGYTVLVVFYYFIRIFLRGGRALNLKEARSILNKTSPMPDMKTTAHNNEPQKDLSIIVPAYNAEKTIIQCITSVIRQKTKYDYEMIIINDGSTDKTQKKVESVEDLHIKLINQENRGFSGARNRGIDESLGKYIMFLDSDDMLNGECIENMMNQIIENEADIVQGSYYSFIDDNNKQDSILSDGVYTDTEAMVCNPGFPWAKIYKREMFTQLRFPLDVWFEDTIVCMILYRMCKKMVVMSDIVYAYRINPEGITKKARHSKKCIDHYWVMEYVLNMAGKLEIPSDNTGYKLVSGHMSTLLYRRISLMEEEVIESAFVLACDMLDNIRPNGYRQEGKLINKDIEEAFINRNYKLWKLASFIV